MITKMEATCLFNKVNFSDRTKLLMHILNLKMIPEHSLEGNLVSIWDRQRLDGAIDASCIMTEGTANTFSQSRLMVANEATDTIPEDIFRQTSQYF